MLGKRIGLMVVGAAVTVSASCNVDQPCAGQCGTIVVNITGPPETVLPVFATSVNADAISGLLFLPLAEIGNDLGYVGDTGFQPRIARSWTVEDSVTIVFELDPRARWTDGEPVTARDVVFTYELYRDPIVNSDARDDIASIVAVQARDTHSVAFTFSEAYPQQFYDATYHMRVHPAHLLDSIPHDALRSHAFARMPVGNGPYQLSRWDANGSVTLIANDDFFLGSPGIARVVVQVVPDLNTTITQLLAEEADFTDFLGGPGNVERLAAAPQVDVIAFPSLAYGYVAFNFHDPGTDDRPHRLFSDVNVRTALTLALDRQAIATATLGEFGAVPFGPVSRANALWQTDLPPRASNPDRAGALLDAAGWVGRDAEGYRTRDGARLTFELLVPSSSGLRRQAAIIMESQLRAVGVALQIEELEFTTWEERSRMGRFDATFGIWGQDPSPTGATTGAWGSGGSENWGRYSSPAFDSLLTGAGRAVDPAAVQVLWRDAFELLQRDAPAIWMFAPSQTAGVHSRLEEVFIRSDNWGATLWQWRINRSEMLPRDRVGIP